MARLIQKSGYIKNGKATGYMEYVATRDGVEIIQSTEPVTKKQEQFIKRLLKDFPDAKELSSTATTYRRPIEVQRPRLSLPHWTRICTKWNPKAAICPTSPSVPVPKSTVVMVCSARRTPPTSRRRRPSWKLTMGKCGRSFSPCGVRMRSVWDTTKPPRGGIC